MTESSLKLVNTFEGHENEVKHVAFNKDGTFLASCGRDKTVWVWDVGADELSCNAVLNGHTQDVKHVQWLPNDDQILSCGYDDQVIQWVIDEDEGEWVNNASYKSHASTIWALDLTKNGKIMATVSDDCTTKIWAISDDGFGEDKGKYSLISTLSGYHTRSIYSCSWNSDDTVLATVKNTPT